MKKYLTVAVIFLFLGLAVAPSINANVSKETLVEFTTEVCGLDGGKQTVKLTQQQADEVEDLFNSIRERLNATDTREEAGEIFKEAVVELDKYGLLGRLSVKQAQRLVTGKFQNLKTLDYFEKVSDNLQRRDWGEENTLCLIAGKTTTTLFLPTIATVVLMLSILSEDYPKMFVRILLMLAGVITIPLFIILFILPLKLFNIVTLGDYGLGGFVPAEGWVLTIGLNGSKTWSGNIRGAFGDVSNFLGVIGFTGIRLLKKLEGLEMLYLGTALWVKLV